MPTFRELPFFDEREASIIPSNIFPLDEAIGGGFRTGEFAVLEAPTGCGKSTFMMSLALAGIQNNQKVCYISCGEQTSLEIRLRILCMIADVEFHGRNKPFYSEEEISKIMDASKEKYLDNLTIEEHEKWVDARGIQLTSYMKKHADNGTKFFFIDYIGCFLAEDTNTTYSYLAGLASELKHFSDETNTLVFTVTQTNRRLSDELVKRELDLSTIDKTFMADSQGIAVKATIGLAMFEYKGNKYINLFKNRLNGKKGYCKIVMTPKNCKTGLALGEFGSLLTGTLRANDPFYQE